MPRDLTESILLHSLLLRVEDLAQRKGLTPERIEKGLDWDPGEYAKLRNEPSLWTVERLVKVLHAVELLPSATEPESQGERDLDRHEELFRRVGYRVAPLKIDPQPSEIREFTGSKEVLLDLVISSLVEDAVVGIVSPFALADQLQRYSSLALQVAEGREQVAIDMGEGEPDEET